MKCFYHNDLDGHCSAAIITKYLKQYNLKFKDKDFIESNYNKVFPFEVIQPDEKIYIVDYSLGTLGDWKKLQSTTKDIVWIDHHISAIEKFQHLDFEGIRKDGTAACELVWQYFYDNIKVPYAVKLLGDYDVWNNSDIELWENKILLFQYAMRSYESNPLESTWDILLTKDKDVVLPYLEEGKTLSRYIKKQYKEITDSKSFEIDFEGKKAIVCNTSEKGSALFDSAYNESKHDIMIPFSSDGKAWNVSLYSTKDKVDCSKIATKYGGGGHKKAAGFTCKKLPFSNII